MSVTLKGVMSALLTSFNADLYLDAESLRPLVRFDIKQRKHFFWGAIYE